MADLEFIGHLASLSGLHFAQEELEKMAKDMEDIMGLMDQIKHVPVHGASNQQIEYRNLRKDIVQESENRQLEFVVPKIVG